MTLKNRLYRARGWFRRLMCQNRGEHTAEGGDWGYGMNGMVDRFCPHCLQLVDRIPLDDFDGAGDVIEAMDLWRATQSPSS